MAKKKMKPKAKQLPAKKKKAKGKKERPTRGFDTARLDHLAEQVMDLVDRVRALEQAGSTDQTVEQPDDAEAEEELAGVES